MYLEGKSVFVQRTPETDGTLQVTVYRDSMGCSILEVEFKLLLLRYHYESVHTFCSLM